jgi:hypothetical protein
MVAAGQDGHLTVLHTAVGDPGVGERHGRAGARLLGPQPAARNLDV